MPGVDIDDTDEYMSFPSLVIDFNCLFEKKLPIIARIAFLRAAWEDYNLYLWRAKERIALFDYRWRELHQVYEVDYIDSLICSPDKLKAFLEIHRTIVLTQEPKLVKLLGFRAVPHFDYQTLHQNFEFWARRVRDGSGGKS